MLMLLQQFMTLIDPEQLYERKHDELTNFTILLFCKNKTGAYIGCNDAFAARLGFDNTQKILGRTDFDLCWSDSAPSFRLNDLQVIKNEKPRMTIETGKLLNGEIGKAMSYKLPLRSVSTHEVTGVIGIAIEFNQEDCSVDLLSHSIHTSQLTKRQKECLFYLCKGMSIKQIAKVLMLSPRTVEHYLETVREKLNCHSLARLVEKVFESQVKIK
ncbi:helix-turn-helix domain-containing protein [Legionella cherrii]|uniref:LuxR family transcriptional regulator n=1 Tax=Legionella cherrii TaxID=28084 RepID=A0A0W0S7N8_9GAMM|nr:helix-turn-helix transcriptional regulator [Legionella cherrii]KTC79092.1 LuxR family transcriptional regulator [Legionella cherrii]VEB36533.1 LuxR family transcriptional regulator [Legionella cherrii]